MLDEYYPDFLVERPAKQRIWVVRASGGAYVRHFVQYGIVAIGHLDELMLPKGSITAPTVGTIQTLLRKKYPQKPRSSITSHANQVRSLCADMALGDLVITVTSNTLIVGRVTGEAFIDPTPLVITDSQGAKHSMDHQLRREVVWGPTILRANVPASVEMTMLAHQTIFSLDKYWDSIYHLLYPCFYFDGKLYLSANIRQRSALDNYSISQFFGLLSGIEAAARHIASLDQSFETVDLAKVDTSQLNLTSKAEFMSPGSVWSTVEVAGSALIWLPTIYVMLFGGDVKFFKADGILDLKTRQKLWGLVIKLIEKYQFQEVQKKLKVEIPSTDASALVAPTKRTRKVSAKNTATLKDTPPNP